MSGSLCALHLPPDHKIHGGEADGCTDELTDALSPEHAVYTESDARQKQRQRCDQKDLSEHGKKQCVLWIIQGHEGGLSTHLQSHEREGKEVDPGTMDRQVDQLRIVGKDSDDRSRDQENHGPHQDIDRKTAKEDKADAFRDTAAFFGAVVIAHDILAGIGDAAVRQAHDLADGIIEAHGADVKCAERTTPCFQHDVHDRLRNAGGDLEGKSGRAELQQAANLALIDQEFLKAERRALTSKEKHYPQGADALGEDRGQCRALDAHTEGEDEKRVKCDIHDGADDDGQHADLREPLCVDERIHAETQKDRDRADHVNAEIADCVRQREFITAEKLQEPWCENEEKYGERGADQEKKRKRRAQHALRFGIVFFSSGNRGQRGSSGTA